jgi:hypothetical protein
VSAGRPGVKWDTVADLGKVRDSVIARRFGVSPAAVHYARTRRGIPAYEQHRAIMLPPDVAVALGLAAAEVGVTVDDLVVGCLREQFCAVPR